MNSLGIKLQSLIRERKISISEVARAIEVSPKTLSEWVGINARFPSNPLAIKKMASYFHIGVHELLYDEQDPFSKSASKTLDGHTQYVKIEHGLYEVTLRRVELS